MFRTFLQEDTIFGDVTSEYIIPPDITAEGIVFPREKCVVAGLEYLRDELISLGFDVWISQDGKIAERNEAVMKIRGNARKLLMVERTVLNILGRLSGIATETRKVVDIVKEINPNIRIAATRKTLWGRLDKMAVILGGGDPHRWSLGDMVMIKDNHIALVGFEEAIKRAKRVSFTKKIEVEVENGEMAIKAARMGVDIIMLDNLSPDEVCKISREIRRHSNAIIEVSGGITPNNVKDYAKCDIDVISMGHLTHSVRSINFSMEVKRLKNI